MRTKGFEILYTIMIWRFCLHSDIQERVMTMAASATLLIRQLAGAPLSLRLQPTSTVAQLKAAVAAKASVAVDSQRVRASPHFFVISSRLRVPAVRAASDAPRAPCADCVFWQRARQPEALNSILVSWSRSSWTSCFPFQLL